MHLSDLLCQAFEGLTRGTPPVLARFAIDAGQILHIPPGRHLEQVHGLWLLQMQLIMVLAAKRGANHPDQQGQSS